MNPPTPTVTPTAEQMELAEKAIYNLCNSIGAAWYEWQIEDKGSDAFHGHVERLLAKFAEREQAARIEVANRLVRRMEDSTKYVLNETDMEKHPVTHKYVLEALRSETERIKKGEV